MELAKLGICTPPEPSAKPPPACRCEQTGEESSERNSVYALKCNIAIDTNLLDQGLRLGLKDDREKTSSVTNQMALFQVLPSSENWHVDSSGGDSRGTGAPSVSEDLPGIGHTQALLVLRQGDAAFLDACVLSCTRPHCLLAIRGSSLSREWRAGQHEDRAPAQVPACADDALLLQG